MNNVIMRTVSVSTVYSKLSATKLVGSVTISTPPTNTSPVLFKADVGSDVPWVPGEWHDFTSINLADIQIRGTNGDLVTIIGGTW